MLYKVIHPRIPETRDEFIVRMVESERAKENRTLVTTLKPYSIFLWAEHTDKKSTSVKFTLSFPESADNDERKKVIDTIRGIVTGVEHSSHDVRFTVSKNDASYIARHINFPGSADFVKSR